MSPSMIRRKVEEEVARVPDESIAKLYDLVHHFRLRPQLAGNADRIKGNARSHGRNCYRQSKIRRVRSG